MDTQQQASSNEQSVATTVAPGAGGLLDSIVSQTGIARNPANRDRARDLIDELFRQVMDGAMTVDRDLEATLAKRISQIDQAISRQLNEVMHAPEFQRLEGTWRGLHKLVHDTETSNQLQIKVLNVTKKELHRDVSRAVEFDQSVLFKKIYQEGYGVLGGAPFGAIVGDYYFDNSPQDVELLKGISGVAAAAHAPFISGVNPELLRMSSFTALEDPRDLSRILTGPEYIDWNSFRDSEDSRYVALTLPHYLCRLPYGMRTVRAEGFDFEEDVDGRTHNRYLWGNAAWLLAGRITNAFARHGWCTAIRGVEGGGLVENLPIHTFQEDGAVAFKCPTEISITDTREKELSDLGFIALTHSKGDNFAAFMGGQSAQRPKKYSTDSASASAQLSARLPYLMAVSRIAHYLKCIVRDKVGGSMTRETLERYLAKWLAQYVLADDTATEAQIAKKPLREARILIEEVPGQPGVYRAVAHLRPFIQLEAVNISLRLVANLPPPAK